MKKLVVVLMLILFSVSNAFGFACATSTDPEDNTKVCLEDIFGSSTCLPAAMGSGVPNPPKCSSTVIIWE